MKKVRIFLASSNEMQEEREIFPSLLNEINQDPALDRTYMIVPVQWETSAHVVNGEGNIQLNINESVKYDELDVVIIAIQDRIGDGTRKEYHQVRELFIKRQSPKFRIMFRQPNAEADTADLKELAVFKEELLREGTVTNVYRNLDEFKGQLADYLPAVLLGNDNAPSRREVDNCVKIYERWTLVSAILAIAGLFIASKMTFPDVGVSRFSELYILVVQPVLFIGYVGSIAYLHKLLTLLRNVWFSRNWKNDEIYEGFQPILPKYILPESTRVKFSALPLWSTILSSFLLFCSLILIPVTLYSLLFIEMVTWEVAVGHEHTPPADGSIFPDARYRDRGGIKMWLFGLQNEEAKRHHHETNNVIYVYAKGQFGKEGFRGNLGDEVFLPWQGRIYLMLLVLSCMITVYTIYQLSRYHREFD